MPCEAPAWSSEVVGRHDLAKPCRLAQKRKPLAAQPAGRDCHNLTHEVSKGMMFTYKYPNNHMRLSNATGT